MQRVDSLRHLRARHAALLMHAAGKTNTAPARAALASRWEVQVDPDGLLDSKERERRAKFARRAFYTELAIKSPEARRARAARKRRSADPGSAAGSAVEGRLSAPEQG